MRSLQLVRLGIHGETLTGPADRQVHARTCRVEVRLTRAPPVDSATGSGSLTSSRRRRTSTAPVHERLEPVSERDRPLVTTHERTRLRVPTVVALT